MSSAEASTPRIIRDISYTDAGKTERRQSFDLYLPADTSKPVPLMAFVHGGFWLLSDDDYRIGPALAESLVNHGIAVALIRYRLAPVYRHPAQAEDVALAVARLIQDSSKYGYDGRRIYMSGHSAGGHLVSLVGLDRRYLERHGIGKNSLAGVISISGLYDLNPTWRVSSNQSSAADKTFAVNRDERKQASPVHHVRADAPPFLVVTATDDFPGFATDAHRFAEALRQVGAKQVRELTVKGTDHFSVVKLDDPKRELRRALANFMNSANR